MEIISTLLISAAVVAIISLIRYVWKRRAFGRIMAEFAGVAPYYDEIISRYFMYYNRLSSEAKQKFLFRTFLFKKSKKFHYVEISESPEMPVLISAVAVQLTLGLDKYLLNYFRNIYVLREDYHYGHYSMPFMGHVDRSGIYLSWDNFLKGVEKASSP
ncbi:MAG TPA: zinc-dependent peptidase, partial [Parasegetibacter sp.]